MGPTTPELKIIYSSTANKEIQGIWKYNAEFYSSAEHATDYVNFLYKQMERLSTDYGGGRKVATADKLRYIVMRRSLQGNGHIAVYRITKTSVRITRVLHTSQNWRSKLSRDRNDG